jgi:hypothetical protein
VERRREAGPVAVGNEAEIEAQGGAGAGQDDVAGVGAAGSDDRALVELEQTVVGAGEGGEEAGRRVEVPDQAEELVDAADGAARVAAGRKNQIRLDGHGKGQSTKAWIWLAGQYGMNWHNPTWNR